MPPLSSFSRDEIAERWAKNIKECESSIEAIRSQVDAADKALIAAGIASVGSLAERIERLAAERDVVIEECS